MRSRLLTTCVSSTRQVALSTAPLQQHPVFNRPASPCLWFSAPRTACRKRLSGHQFGHVLTYRALAECCNCQSSCTDSQVPAEDANCRDESITAQANCPYSQSVSGLRKCFLQQAQYRLTRSKPARVWVLGRLAHVRSGECCRLSEPSDGCSRWLYCMLCPILAQPHYVRVVKCWSSVCLVVWY